VKQPAHRASAKNASAQKRPVAGSAQAGAEVDLLARYQAGDAQAFRELVDEVRERIVQVFFRVCWDRDRAEDFTQDLFMRLLRGATKYRPEGRLATFIYRVATNLWIDHYRSVRPQPRLYSLDQPMLDDGPSLAGSAPSAGPGPDDLAIGSEEKVQLRSALDALNESHRLVLELAVYQELPYAEISAILHIPVGTVKSRMHNTVRALRERLVPSATGSVPMTGTPPVLGARREGFRAAGGA
jgi:RNA polymerase sigma-70 factor (ECF subfamily)